MEVVAAGGHSALNYCRRGHVQSKLPSLLAVHALVYPCNAVLAGYSLVRDDLTLFILDVLDGRVGCLNSHQLHTRWVEVLPAFADAPNSCTLLVAPAADLGVGLELGLRCYLGIGLLLRLRLMR
jgi:hypothetical protein